MVLFLALLQLIGEKGLILGRKLLVSELAGAGETALCFLLGEVLRLNRVAAQLGCEFDELGRNIGENLE